MDKVITCYCGNQSWVIGMSGTRCNRCGSFLRPNSVIADIEEINDFIHSNPRATNESI